MEFLANHTDRHQQVTVLQNELSIRYAKLQMQYETLHQEMLDYKTRANYWEAQFNKFKSREDTLKAEIDELKAKLRKREQQLFGKKSEQGKSGQDQLKQSQAPSTSKKKKGQQPDSKGHGKRNYDHLPAVEETVSLLEKDAMCPCCHLPYEELLGTENSEILEVINVKPYRRLIRRKQYKRNCICEKNTDPQIITPPPSERLIPKCKFGISIWAYLLVKKFEYQQPLHRTLAELKGNGLSLAKGTATGGFQKLLPLVIPAYDAIVGKSVAAKHWHADRSEE